MMDLAHVAGNHQHLVSLKFHERRWGNKSIHRYRAPADLRQNVVHLLDTRNSVKGDAGVEKHLEINFVRVLAQEKHDLAHIESQDRMIYECVIAVSLIDRELE